jgi:hypothetical protein
MGRVRQKECDRCLALAAVLYRVRLDGSGRWHFICPTCFPAVSEGNPDYAYGGTWKAQKK